MITRTNNIEMYGLVEFGREMKVKFSSKPNEAITSTLKSLGFKFSPYNGWTKSVQSKGFSILNGSWVTSTPICLSTQFHSPQSIAVFRGC